MHPILTDIKLFISDFDETVTMDNTMQVLGAAAFRHTPDFSPSWDYFESAYYQDYLAHMSGLESTPNSNADIDEITKHELEIQESLRKVELQSVKRVRESQLFKNVPEQYVRDEARTVKIRSGWWPLCKNLNDIGTQVAIVSVNWSDVLIDEVFRINGWPDVEIHANRINVDKNSGKFTNTFECKLRTGNDKANLIKLLKEREKGPVCYCGDSTTDFLGLLAADIGLIVGNSESLLKKAKQWNIKVIPLNEYPNTDDNTASNVLYQIQTFDELL